MLYVFLVCSGSMICLDMNLAVKKVIDLKAEIQRITQIHILDQVLLCSGGETLLSDNIVGNYYGAGTDTNPIYLFSKNSCDPELFYDGHIKSALDPDMDYEVRNCAGMLPSIQGFTVKVALAQRFADNATRGKKECLELVHFQHLQQQGWSAVIANLEDSKESLIRRHKQFEEAYEKYLSKRDSYLGMIQQIPGDFNLLSKIPVLNRLLPLKNNTETDSEYTLLTWFCSESEDILNNFLEVTRKTLEQMDDKTLVNLKEDLVRVLQNIEDPKFTEVPGIEDRLSMLNKRTQEVAELEKNQNEIYIKFNKNMTNTKDPNVLPDLCQTFQNQLQVMLENHQRIVENLERCTKAKLELSDSINARIKHISNIHNEMINLLKFFELHEGRIKYLKKQINCFHDVHNAPERYLKLLAEVCRRKEFSIKYLKWSKHLSSNVSKLYEKEITIRKSFQSHDLKNMVDNLFSGMVDVPPSFAVECPQPFDQNLPNVFKDDLECMKDILPELSHLCEVLPTENMPWILREDSLDSAFSSNISSSQKTSSVEVSPSQILKVHAKISALQKFIQDFQSGLQGDLSSLKALVKEEISARMDEACQAVGSINLYVEKLHSHLQAERDETISKAKSEFSVIEKNYQHRLEVEGQKLNDAENQISSYEEYLKMALTNNEELKLDKDELTNELDEQREVVKRMTLEYELEIDSLKDQLKEIGHKQTTEVSELQEALAHATNEIAKNKVDRHQIQIQCNENLLRHQEELFKMQEDNKKLKNNLNELNEQIDELQQPVSLVTEMELKKANEENERLLNELESLRSASESAEKREADLKELVQILKKKHKTELEDLSLRYQFVELQKLVERATSPIKEILESESIHVIKAEEDKIEPVVTKQEVGTVTDALSTEHEEEKQKLTESLQLEREEALEKLKSRLLAENQVSFNEAINRLAKEKDVTIEDLRIQISQSEAKMSTIKSCLEKYFAQLELKVSPMCKSISSSSSSSNITEQQVALGKLRSELRTFLASDYHPSSSLTRSTHPSLEVLQRVKSGSSLCWNCSNRLSVLSCEEGDIVLVCFEAKFKNFVIFHLGQYTHFLHPDCLQVLNLKMPDSSTVPGQGSWSLGVVQHKEFCITKKEENRYNIPIDTKFFRVKVKAWDRDAALAYHQWHRSVHAVSSDASKSFSRTSGGMSTSSI